MVPDLVLRGLALLARGGRAKAFATLAPRVRVAFFLLLLANLAFFAWAHWLAPKEAQLPVSPKVDAPRLQLATEAAAVPAPTAAASPSDPSPPTSSPPARARH